MRVFMFGVGVLLCLVSLVAAFEGASAFVSAKSSFHQIYGAVQMVLFAVSLGGGCVLLGMASLIDVNMRKTSSVPVERKPRDLTSKNLGKSVR